MYRVTRHDDNTRGRSEYFLGTNDALKAADNIGRGETGEVIRVYDDNGRIVSAAYWDSRYRKYRLFTDV